MGAVTDRAQLVLVTGAVAAIAFLPVLVAVIQAGGPPPTPQGENPFEAVSTSLDAGVGTMPPLASEYNWSERRAASRDVRRQLGGLIERLRSPTRTGIRTVEWAPTTAATVAAEDCPSGPNQVFGPCRNLGGVVLQERGGATHLVAVVVRVTVTEPDGRRSVTLVVASPTRLVADPPD